MMLAALLFALQDPAAAPSARAAQRMELRRDVARLNGVWKLHEWGHYFVLTDVYDPGFLEQLERHVFEAREACVRLFPEAEADPVRDDRRLVVLRVTKSEEEYHSYGGPGGSTGYWSTPGGEIVVHDDPDRSVTWDALAGCVASAFLDEFFGNAPRAGWIESGLSEYCGGLFRARRLGGEDLSRWPTLGEFLGLPQSAWFQHLGEPPDLRLVAWSWMRFLCDEERRGPDFDPRWAGIPERYAVGWVAHKDEVKARAFAFEGLDLAALERAWRASLVLR